MSVGSPQKTCNSASAVTPVSKLCFGLKKMSLPVMTPEEMSFKAQTSLNGSPGTWCYEASSVEAGEFNVDDIQAIFDCLNF